MGKLYMALTNTTNENIQLLRDTNVKNVLISFFMVKNFKKYPLINTYKKIEELLDIEAHIFLDSGAFSAWSLKQKISMNHYCKYIESHNQETYSVLDAIGDFRQTFINQLKMEEMDMKPLPCFHYGEPMYMLDYYCQNYNYVSLGGMVPISTKNLITWLDSVYGRHPHQKFHGFGVTTDKILERYPWYSVDSSSWNILQISEEDKIKHNIKGSILIGYSKSYWKKYGQEIRNKYLEHIIKYRNKEKIIGTKKGKYFKSIFPISSLTKEELIQKLNITEQDIKKINKPVNIPIIPLKRTYSYTPKGVEIREE